jgi:hypothetical protein
MNCYRFPSRAVFRALAAVEGLTVADDAGVQRLRTASHTHALDEIGIIWVGGTYDPATGDVITPPTALPGWHVNAVGISPEAWDQHLVVVNSAARVWFGGPTQAPDDDTLEAMA